MILNRLDRDDLQAPKGERRSYACTDVIELVSRLGDAATQEFLEGLKPHLAAVQAGERRAGEELAMYLHGSAVSAAVLLSAGGPEAFREAEERAGAAEAMSIDAATAVLSEFIN